MFSIKELKQIAIFGNLSNAELASILPLIQKTTFSSEETILTHSETSTNAYLLVKGTVRSTTFSSNGKEICFQHLSEGEMFGELSAIDGLPRTTSIIAQTDCILGVIETSRFWRLLEDYPSIMEKVLQRMSGLIRFLCSRVYEYGALGTRDRTRAEILRLAKQHMTDDQNAVITNMPTHEDIANRIASHREAVTKEFSYLTKLGLLQKQGRTLIVPDVHALSATLIESIA